MNKILVLSTEEPSQNDELISRITELIKEDKLSTSVVLNDERTEMYVVFDEIKPDELIITGMIIAQCILTSK